MVAGHAGRDSLLFAKKSTILSSLEVLFRKGSKAKNIRVTVVCGISEKYFTHKKRNKKTKKILEILKNNYPKKTFSINKDGQVCLNLNEIIVSQCRKFGKIKRKLTDIRKIFTCVSEW